MHIPVLGPVSVDAQTGWLISEKYALPLLRGGTCQLALDAYEEDPDKDSFHRAIEQFLSADFSILKAAEPYIFQYYQEMAEAWEAVGDSGIVIDTAADIWNHIQLADSPLVFRRKDGDKKVYISLECNCDWEQEHGLEIVLREGAIVCKVGPYDGWPTNGDSSGDSRLEALIYRSFKD